MQSRKIGVLLGGLSSEREVSLRTGEAVLVALQQRGHDVIPIYVDRDIDVALRQEKIDVAFIALHGRWGEDGSIQGMLEMLGIPYTGSDVLASALAMHKGKAKEMFRLHNLPTPAYYSLTASETSDLEGVHGDFGFPCVVKPIREGSSEGVTICASMAELAPAVEKALCFDDELLVERFIIGKEVSVAIVDDRAIGARADVSGVSALPRRQSERVDDDRFSGPGLAGEHVQPGTEFDGEVFDRHEVANA